MSVPAARRPAANDERRPPYGLPRPDCLTHVFGDESAHSSPAPPVVGRQLDHQPEVSGEDGVAHGVHRVQAVKKGERVQILGILALTFPEFLHGGKTEKKSATKSETLPVTEWRKSQGLPGCASLTVANQDLGLKSRVNDDSSITSTPPSCVLLMPQVEQ